MCSVTVSGSNNPPTAVDDTLEAVGPFGQSAVGQVNVLDNDTDPESQTLTITGVTNGTKGTVGWVGGVVTYTISDGAGGTDTGTVTVGITRE